MLILLKDQPDLLQQLNLRLVYIVQWLGHLVVAEKTRVRFSLWTKWYQIFVSLLNISFSFHFPSFGVVTVWWELLSLITTLYWLFGKGIAPIRSYSVVVSTPDFESGIRGSSPRRSTAVVLKRWWHFVEIMKAKASTYFLIFFLASTQTLGNYEWDFISGSGRDFLEWCWFHRGGHCKSKRPPPACWFAPPIYLGGFENQTCLPPCFGRNHVKTDFLSNTRHCFSLAMPSLRHSQVNWNERDMQT